MKAYQAYSKHGSVTELTPKQAAQVFFSHFPSARKCNITQGETDGQFFTVTYGNRFSNCGMPESWKDVSKKQVNDLPNNAVKS